MKLDSVTKEQWDHLCSIYTSPEDRFARTFYAKCNMLKAWDQVVGAYDEKNVLMGAILTTIGRKYPICANLQLLHTFNRFRGQGVGRLLCETSLEYAVDSSATYFRLSSEPDAVEFYRKVGLKFWGMQKSGCQLSLFRIGGKKFSQGIYDPSDAYIQAKTAPSKAKGSIVTKFISPM